MMRGLCPTLPAETGSAKPMKPTSPSAPLPAPLPLADLPASESARLSFVLTDIDDTLTTDGRLTAATYGALERLAARGYHVIPVTGARPGGAT